MSDLNKNSNFNQINHKNKSFNSFITQKQDYIQIVVILRYSSLYYLDCKLWVRQTCITAKLRWVYFMVVRNFTSNLKITLIIYIFNSQKQTHDNFKIILIKIFFFNFTCYVENFILTPVSRVMSLQSCHECDQLLLLWYPSQS